ncbi:MAG: hypothetical protein SWX82_30655 [Cyanobacteriota bacterium]|nr:hypothetical protein [Cyanobacteriota bacterium]
MALLHENCDIAATLTPNGATFPLVDILSPLLGECMPFWANAIRPYSPTLNYIISIQPDMI